jgi:hypothetical protein
MLDKILKLKKTKKVIVEDVATEAMVESIKEEAPYKVEAPKKVNPWPRPHHHPVCTCHKCERWKEAENA